MLLVVGGCHDTWRIISFSNALETTTANKAERGVAFPIDYA